MGKRVCPHCGEAGVSFADLFSFRYFTPRCKKCDGKVGFNVKRLFFYTALLIFIVVTFVLGIPSVLKAFLLFSGLLIHRYLLAWFCPLEKRS